MRSPDWVSECGTVRLYQGDSLSLLASFADGAADVVLTDPPYGLGIPYAEFDDTVENVQAMAAVWLPEAQRIAPSVAFTPGLNRERLYPPPKHTACWMMEAGGYFSSWGFGMWQPILCYGKDRYLAKCLGARPDVVRTNGTDRKNKPDHPCPKPLGPWTKIVERFSLPGDTVMDPFMGSGTTGVACVATGRAFIGIEKTAAYFDIAKARISRALAERSSLLPLGGAA